MKNNISENILSILFPPRCLYCGKRVEVGLDICDECERKLNRISPPYCLCCGTSLDDCTCRKQAHAYGEVVAPFYYEGPVRELLLQLKYGGKEDMSRYLAGEMTKVIRERFFGIRFDLLTCVPTTADRIDSRGYNQAQSLAELLAPDPQTGLLEKVERDYYVLKKHPTGKMQHFLGASGRRANIRNAFSLRPGRSVEGKTILLVDDIVTTGATAEECTEILRLNGARQVEVACAAVTRTKALQNGRKDLLF